MTSRIAFALLLATAAVPSRAFAENAAAPAATPAAAADSTIAPAEVKLAGFQLKKRSAYTGNEKTRPPFWPIGWIKRSAQLEAAPQVVEKIELDPDQFNLTSTLLLHPSF